MGAWRRMALPTIAGRRPLPRDLGTAPRAWRNTCPPPQRQNRHQCAGPCAASSSQICLESEPAAGPLPAPIGAPCSAPGAGPAAADGAPSLPSAMSSAPAPCSGFSRRCFAMLSASSIDPACCWLSASAAGASTSPTANAPSSPRVISTVVAIRRTPESKKARHWRADRGFFPAPNINVLPYDVKRYVRKPSQN